VAVTRISSEGVEIMANMVKRLATPVDAVMSRRVVLMLDGIPMREAQALAMEYDYNAFPIVTSDGRLVGMLTKGDMLRAARAALSDPGAWDAPVSRFMARGVLALRPADSVGTAVDHLVDSGLRSLPVIDDESRVVGMVSRNDLMSAIRGELEP
jgi:CBS domain-containing protein